LKFIFLGFCYFCVFFFHCLNIFLKNIIRIKICFPILIASPQ
jgi:hypothetical protein